MRASRHVRRVRGHHRALRGATAELNIVPLIDMMMVLVFFLLFTAVFSRLNILEIRLPAAAASVPELPQGLQLEVIVHEDFIDVGDRAAGRLQHLPEVDGEPDLAGLGEYLRALKANYPDQLEASILLAPTVPYELLVEVMDTVRVYHLADVLGWASVELFPEISVGDAPT